MVLGVECREQVEAIENRWVSVEDGSVENERGLRTGGCREQLEGTKKKVPSVHRCQNGRQLSKTSDRCPKTPNWW